MIENPLTTDSHSGTRPKCHDLRPCERSSPRDWLSNCMWPPRAHSLLRNSLQRIICDLITDAAVYARQSINFHPSSRLRSLRPGRHDLRRLRSNSSVTVCKRGLSIAQFWDAIASHAVLLCIARLAGSKRCLGRAQLVDASSHLSTHRQPYLCAGSVDRDLDRQHYDDHEPHPGAVEYQRRQWTHRCRLVLDTTHLVSCVEMWRPYVREFVHCRRLARDLTRV